VNASFWREWHRELRRHVGDERLPYAVRVRLRGAADRAEERAAAEEQRAIVPRWNRRAIAAAAPVRLSPSEEQQARGLAMEQGIPLDRPLVAADAGIRADRLTHARRALSDEGYHLAWVGSSGERSLVDRYVLQASAFLICRSAELQRVAFETHTPSLRLDAPDPFSAYPVRADGVFTLATVIDLDTGRILPTAELLTERYFRNTRNCGYRGSTAAEIAAAVAEMIEGVRRGWTETAAQMQFRRAVTDAGVALGDRARIRHVVEWDTAGGFVGEGRLARVQAERAS